ncbi:MAG: hypothetical protein ACE149_13645 [Armatimonadota bacterium]
METSQPGQLLTRVENVIERIEELEELSLPESEAATSHRALSAAEIELANELEAEASELLDAEAYAEIASFTADEKTTYGAYWDRLRELRAAFEELRDGLRRTWLRPTEYPDSPEEDVLGPRSEVPEEEDLD